MIGGRPESAPRRLPAAPINTSSVASKPHQIHDENRFLMMIACEGFGATQWECLDRSLHFGAPTFLFYPAADRLGCVQWPRCLAVLHILLSGNPGELKSVSALGNSYDDAKN